MIEDMKRSLEFMLEEERKRKRRCSLIIMMLITVGICFLLMRVIFGISIVKGDSMSPEIPEQSIVIFWRIGNEYQVGDVVIAKLNDTEIIKRVDSIEDGQVFLKGDNRAVSIDSYTFGTISEDMIVGKAICMIRRL